MRSVSDSLEADEPSMLAELALSLYAWQTPNPAFRERLDDTADRLIAMAYAETSAEVPGSVEVSGIPLPSLTNP